MRLALLVVLSSLVLTRTAVAAEVHPADHFHQQDPCKQCHIDGVQIAKVLDVPNNGCLRCHTEAALQVSFDKITTAKQPSPAQSELSAFAPTVPLEPNAGMQLPLYSATSRLGDKPNAMVAIPAGEFIRGSNERLADEGPQYRLNVPAFMIDIYEVTHLQYKHFIDATKRRSPDHFRNRTFPDGKADHPVTFVSWDDANAYCEWAGKRLPTDVEWEKAARGTDGRSFPWGNEFNARNSNSPIRWQALKEQGDTTPVGAFAGGVSPYGVHDMSGNVWEWTSSWYEAYPGNKTPSESYGERYKTLKGGSWFDCSFYKCGISAPVYNRAFFAKKTKNDTFGFRCAKDLSTK